MEAKGHSAFKQSFALQLSSFFLSSTFQICLAKHSFAWKEKKMRIDWDCKSESKEKTILQQINIRENLHSHNWLFPHLSIWMIKMENKILMNNIVSSLISNVNILHWFFFFILHFMCILLLTEMPVMIVFKRSFRLGLGPASSARAPQYQLPFISSFFLKPGSELLTYWLLPSSLLYSFTYYKMLYFCGF